MRKNDQVITAFKILAMIQADPGVNAASLAHAVGLSPSGVRPYLAGLEEAGQISSSQALASGTTGKIQTMQVFHAIDENAHVVAGLNQLIQAQSDWRAWAEEICPELRVGAKVLAARKMLANHVETQEESHSILRGEYDNTYSMKALLEVMAA